MTAFVKKIEQKNNHMFTIQWTDGKTRDYKLSELQANCPCARCVDETSGVRRQEPSLREEVKAVRIESVGRYALKVEFTSGCSTGIYGFDLLQRLGML